MKKKGKWKGILAVVLSMAMAIPSMTGFAAVQNQEEQTEPQNSSEVVEEYAVREGVGRTQLNFNRNWKFIRSDVEGAAASDYDDSSWVDVGLPHNFSIPYEMSSQFYVGYGWYRKEFDIPQEWEKKKIELEFEGVFQVAEIYVNGKPVGTHEGGYSGFTYDITDDLHTGRNLVAVRVNNIWQHDLAPRAGDHQFTGGIYRDVYLNVTEDVHVAWYGTFVTTPDLTNPGFDESAVNVPKNFPGEAEIMANINARRSNVSVQTEVVNSSASAKKVQVLQEVQDEDGKKVAEFHSESRNLAAGETYSFEAVSEQIQNIELWNTENPYLYTVQTSVISDGVLTDTYESSFGFRWAQYRNDAFYLNGEKVLLNGANAHQDHAGFADAVSDEGFKRDVAMIKECGMNFIRGSHYPHDPAYAQACDELGVLFWSECNFWGMGGCGGKDEAPTMSAADWFKDAYPQNPEDEEAFEQSLMDSLEAMIRVNRNHPSVMNWSMGNEVFFTGSSTQNKAKALVNKMRNRAHELDPTRKAGMGGTQREGYDKLSVCDISGYNGDGGKFENTSMPNLVAEYGSKAADRPGEYRPFYDQIQGSSAEEFALKKNSAGLCLWCAFYHGTIGGDGLAKMGMIDYYRLPLNTWYWYREKYTGTAPEASMDGTAVKMELTSSDAVITNDGKKDTKLILTMKDVQGNWVNDTRAVTLTVKDGPGIFPGGKTYTFQPNKSIRDGKASIEFRSYYEGTTVISARAEGLPEAVITVKTENVMGVDDAEEPENFYDAGMWGTVTEKIEEPFQYGNTNAATGRPVFPSSNKLDGELAADGSIATSWTADKKGSGEYFQIDLEFSLYLYKVKLGFDRTPYPYKVETAMDKNAGWTTAAEYTKDSVAERPEEETLDGMEARYVRITFTDVPDTERAFLSEIEVYGNTSSQAPAYTTQSVYLSDAVDYDNIATGWKTPGKNSSCEGGPIRVGGQTYEKGIGLHANSSFIYETDKKYARISGIAGIDDEVSGGNAIFQIYADQKLIYERELSAGQSDPFDLSISGVQSLRLVTDANGDNSQDHTDWADVKLYGAVRDISSQGGKLHASCVGMTSKLRAGEDYITRLGLENSGNQEKTVNAGLALYDSKGKLADYTMKQISLSPGKSRSVELSMEMPENITGCEGRISIWDAAELETESKSVPVEADKNYLIQDGNRDTQWSKIDGEAMEKAGNWKMWPSPDAYQGTETYTGDKDSPLTDDVSISYTFSGSYVRVGAKVDGGQVGADVFIDEVKAGHIDNKAADGTINSYQQVWSSERYTAGRHTVKLIPTGKFGLDYIEIGVEKEKEPESNDRQPLLNVMDEVLKLSMMDRAAGYTLESRAVVGEQFAQAYQVYSSASADLEEYQKAAAILKSAVGGLKASEEAKTVLTGIRLGTDTVKKLYVLGETFSAAGLTVRAVYSDGTEKTLNPVQYKIAGFDSASVGDKRISVSYAEGNIVKLAEYTVKVQTPPSQDKPSGGQNPGGNTRKPVPKKGAVYQTKTLKYKVLKSSAAKGTVAVVGVKKKTLTKVTVPPTIKWNGYIFKVTEIGKKAFYKNKKLKTAVIGKNVTKIGASAFYGNGRLKSLKINSGGLKSVGKKAFKGTSAKLKVDVPSKKVKAYRKLLKNRGLGKAARIK